MGSVGASKGSRDNKLPYDRYDKTVTDTLIVFRDGKYKIQKYNGEDLDVYDHTLEINHDKLISIKVNKGKLYEEIAKDISFEDIYNYLKKEFNFKG